MVICRAPEIPYTLYLPTEHGSATLMEYANGRLEPIESLDCHRGAPAVGQVKGSGTASVCTPLHQSMGGYVVEWAGPRAVVYVRSIDGIFPVAELHCQ